MRGDAGVPASPRVHVGIAGWSIATAQQPAFGAGTSHLARFATRLDVAEINSSFSRPHRRGTYARWADAVPDTFRFTAKVPRALTHDAGLRPVDGVLERFADGVDGLGTKLAVLLVQLPPSLAFDGRIAPAFFRRLRARFGPRIHIACEPRHASWTAPRAVEALHALRIHRVGADPVVIPDGGVPSHDRACRYWRLHGSPVVYRSAYDAGFLAALAARLRTVSARDVYVVFDNTAEGHAVTDALALRQLLDAPATRT